MGELVIVRCFLRDLDDFQNRAARATDNKCTPPPPLLTMTKIQEAPQNDLRSLAASRPRPSPRDVRPFAFVGTAFKGAAISSLLRPPREGNNERPKVSSSRA